MVLPIYKRIVQDGLSVRKVEEIVSASKLDSSKKEKKTTPEYTKQQELLSKRLNRIVKISSNKLVISFRNAEDLNSIINRIH